MESSRLRRFTAMVMLGAMTLGSLSCAGAGSSTTPDAEFGRMDTSKDGKVSADEHAAGAKQMFDTMDADKNATVTAAEMEAAHERVTGSKATASDMTATEKIKVVDADGDGALTAGEHALGSHAMFEKMDTDKDGFLTKDELTAGHTSMMKPSR